MAERFYFCIFALLYLTCFSQEKQIDTVFIFDNQLTTTRHFHKTSILKEDDILKNATNLSEILRFQSPVYIKENGRGMVSSPSFRGTTAQQTAFIWNGININSLMLGQGDINNLNLLGYDNLEVKSGGGSVIYGSGAVGGTIHLNNELLFNRGLSNTIFLEYGSFNTLNSLLKSSYSDDKFSIKAVGNFVQSDNNYAVPEKNYSNLNGEYDNRTINLGAAYKFNPQNTISWQTQIFDGWQHYPVFSEFATKTKYKTNSFRTLADWNMHASKVRNNLKLAYLEDEFQYFGNIRQPKTSGGATKIHLAKNDFKYIFNDQFRLNSIAEYQLNQATGYQSGIGEVNRSVGSVAVLLHWKPDTVFQFEAGAKKDFVQDIKTPFLFSFSGKAAISDWYSVVFNTSRNFRYPSFNDLYWQPGGNLDLKSEISHQAEIGNNFKYKNFSLNVTPYYIRIKNMIRWLPGSTGIWSPTNTSDVESYGIESQMNLSQKFSNQTAKFSVGYIYTHSMDLKTGQYLAYVPQHKIFADANYRYDIFELFIQGMSSGVTYTTDDENMDSAIPFYFVMNSGVYIRLLNIHKIGFKVNNIFNQIYETSAYFPLPKRNYSANLLINF